MCKKFLLAHSRAKIIKIEQNFFRLMITNVPSRFVEHSVYVCTSSLLLFYVLMYVLRVFWIYHLFFSIPLNVWLGAVIIRVSYMFYVGLILLRTQQ